jgi:tetratricopeptide (TPR) repeat protein
MDHGKAIALAQHFVLAQQGERALHALQDASPELSESWLWRANAMQQVGRYQEAIESAQRGLAIDAESSYLHHAVARAELMLGHLAEAEAAIEESLRLEPDEPEAIALHAAILNARGKRRLALEAVRRAEKLAPEMRAVRVIRAMLLRSSDADAALRISRELLAAEPEGAVEHWLHGGSLVRLGRLREADDHFARAAALDPTDPLFTGAARVSRHWFFWPLRVTSPVLFWLALYSVLPLLLFAAMFGGVLWTALWCAVAWASYAVSYLFAFGYTTRVRK